MGSKFFFYYLSCVKTYLCIIVLWSCAILLPIRLALQSEILIQMSTTNDTHYVPWGESFHTHTLLYGVPLAPAELSTLLSASCIIPSVWVFPFFPENLIYARPWGCLLLADGAESFKPLSLSLCFIIIICRHDSALACCFCIWSLNSNHEALC